MKPTEMHISICGHAKHGKSTLAGRLMYALGAISDNELENLREEAEKRGKDFNEFSLMFLKHRSITFGREGSPDDPSRTVFPERGSVTLKDGRLVTLIDTPGFSRYLDNIIYGIYLSDLAIVIVEAAAGIERGTKEVTRILSSFAIPIIAIFVTKMDVVGYSELRFQEIKEALQESILPITREYLDYEPPIIPISALSGAGFGKPIRELQWYSGIDALQAIEKAQITYAPEAISAVRFVIEGSKEIYSPPGVGTVLVGTLETGKIHSSDDLVLEPASKTENRSITTRVRSVQRARSVTEKKVENVDIISARAIVAIAASGLSVHDAERYFRHGGVLGTRINPPSVANEIEAEVIFFEPNTFYSGKDYVIHTNASHGMARILEIETRDKIKYNLDKDKYDAYAAESVRARLRFEQPLCIESSKDFQRLTLFLLRERNRVVACGRCVSIVR